uniref:Uncharacterized protein n=1 Tax=Anopheles atroparvus TaxID=41427 RepID=A0AAG5DH19_ANOAO
MLTMFPPLIVSSLTTMFHNTNARFRHAITHVGNYRIRCLRRYRCIYYRYCIVGLYSDSTYSV